jgi:transposase
MNKYKPKRHKYSKLFRDLYVFLEFLFNEIIIKDDVVHIFLKRKRKRVKCPHCKKRNRYYGESYKRTVRDLDLGNKLCFITFFEAKLFCKCGFRGYESVDFARRYSHCTIRYEDYVYKLCEKMTISDVSDIVGLNWKTVKRIDVHYIKQRLEKIENINPKRIGIDEIAYEKGHKYLTIIRDLDLNSVIWVGLNRKKITLDDFFLAIGDKKRVEIDVIVCDMWDPYISSIHDNCPQCDLVFDKFHVVKKVNEALDQVRKQEFAKASDEERKKMKHKRFFILKRSKNLTDDQKESLFELIGNNITLYKAYLLKEQLSDIFDETDIEIAEYRLEKWIENVNESNIPSFLKVVKTIKRYNYGIRNYFIHRVTNAGSEGFNTKINIVKRRAYGFWDLEYFIMKIFQTCGVMRL